MNVAEAITALALAPNIANLVEAYARFTKIKIHHLTHIYIDAVYSARRNWLESMGA